MHKSKFNPGDYVKCKEQWGPKMLVTDVLDYPVGIDYQVIWFNTRDEVQIYEVSEELLERAI